MALSVAGCAAYFSVWGLSQLFAGASFAVIVMASVLEIGKLVVTTALHTYWDKFAKPLRVYLAISVIVLMLITSAGIYGFLSNAYQKTANKLEIHEGELNLLDGKKIIFQKAIDNNQKIIETKNKRLDQLSGLRISQETRIDGSNSNRDRNSVRGDISSANTEIQKLSVDIDVLNAQNATLSDSIGKYNLKSLETKSTSDVAGEVGPLKYIAELTGISMAKVVNYLILLLIFVFDPLAISLVLATNKVFELDGKKTPLEPIEEDNKIEYNDDFIKMVKAYKERDEERHEEPIHEPFDEVVNEVVNEAVNEVVIEEPIIAEPIIKEIKANKITVEEIKEANRGYSVPVPQPKGNNAIERINNRFF
tara:strand:- start:30348 stop:31439 length:1092 start_codon:yes stop_codon:yes gene_type:complete